MPIFGKSGISIAMRNAQARFKITATAVTTSYNNERFAEAMERFFLGEER
jgi:hydroxymethylpyrimidine pyrophosphatase-like HAD family hydrolase